MNGLMSNYSHNNGFWFLVHILRLGQEQRSADLQVERAEDRVEGLLDVGVVGVEPDGLGRVLG